MTEEVAIQIFTGIAFVFIFLKLMAAAATFFGSTTSATKKGWVRKKLELPDTWIYSVPIGTLMILPILKFFSGRGGHILLLEEGGQEEYWLVDKIHWEDARNGSHYTTQPGDIPIIIETEQVQ